jgi:Asp/Glu/hydantoin racemase
MATDVVDAARRLAANSPRVAAIVLECANMPPYRDAVAAATGLPLFDAAQCLAWFHRGIERSARRHAAGDLW